MNRCPDCQGELSHVKSNLYQCTKCGEKWTYLRDPLKANKVALMEYLGYFSDEKRAKLNKRLSKQ